MSHITEEKCIEILTECSELLEEEIDLNKVSTIIEKMENIKISNFKMATPNEPTGLYLPTPEISVNDLISCGVEPGCSWVTGVVTQAGNTCEGCGFC